MDEKLWFRRKKYGWGWTPNTWQGWTAVIVTVFGIIFGMTTDSLFTIAASAAALIVVSYVKGPKPEWRWGKTK